MTFWDFFWLMVWGFIFISYLMVLFQVVIDLFRDRGLSGVQRVIWVVALFLAPPLTALVYVIVRGRGMSMRQQADAQQNRTEAEQYLRSIVGTTDPAAQIASAKGLLDSGAITAAEFEALKAKALA